MKQRNYQNWFLPGTILLLAGLLCLGCRLVYLPVAVAVGTVGVVTYSVYQGGESVVTGVGDMASGGSKDSSKAGETVVFTGKVLKVDCPGSVEEVWLATTSAFRQANFQDLAGNYDLLSGELTAQTWEKMPVTVRLKSEEKNRTTLWIWTGPQGDLKASESIYNLILSELQKTAAARPTASQKEVAP